MNIETRTIEFAGLETRDTDDGHYLTGIVAPFQSTYDNQSYIETFTSSTFDKSTSERGQNIPLLEQHDTSRHPIGMSVRWEKSAEGLIGEFKLAPTPRGEEARTLAATGMVTGLSVGFIPIRNKTSTVNGRQQIARLEAKLDHVGLITTGRQAYSDAKVLSVRAYDPDDPETAPLLAKWRHLLVKP